MAGEPSSFTKWNKPTAQQQFETQILKDNTDDRRRIQLTAPLATEIPVIDVHRFVSATDAEVFELHSALGSWGCFQVVNHGIEKSLLDKVRQIGREFFQLPRSEKQKYATNGDEDEGYSTDLRQVEEEMLKLLAKSLSLSDEKIFVRKTEVMYAQFNYYPPCPKPERVLGLREHADASLITILLQDDRVEGLQLLKDGTWFSVPIMPHALLVIAGDQLEIMSNGIFKSPVHRVIRVSSETERCTLAVFCSPDFMEEIEPLDELVVHGHRPRMFNKVTNYIGFYYPYFYKGKRAIDALRI
ncbi:hypothetical protein C2S53_016422 [Perilla frutescens var. hirtella]|uniref:Fe2OG dioxygenase domain-containing protein n=1 Tax=Perilla frutescens var. hirtella TaxID=608512 RepID=A0AAD4J845_PERFH|nr:hypothetical protein C2S53_016422 [Perilla frutescens var. hirtella]